MVKEGDRIKLVYTNDLYTKLRTGDMGTVNYVDPREIGVKWDSGSTLSLIPIVDSYEVVA